MAMKPLTTEQKQALATLRASLGGVSEEKRQAQKHLLGARKAILKMLETQPATIPQIAEALHMPSDEALWHVTGMRKYGKVAEAGEDGDYLLYAPVAYEEKPAAGH
jgi:predicted Rossmann fold nucleotide-binding protein DprA/Smf involved in DNA uptake